MGFANLELLVMLLNIGFVLLLSFHLILSDFMVLHLVKIQFCGHSSPAKQLEQEQQLNQ